MAEIKTGTMTSFQLAGYFDLRAIREFVKQQEPKAVNLASHLKQPSLWPSQSFLITAKTGNDLTGCCFFHSKGLILSGGETMPVHEQLAENAKQLVKNYGSRFNTMIGTPDQLSKIKKLLPGLSFFDVEYDFYSTEKTVLHHPNPDIEVRQAQSKDYAELVELQCLYEIEEVLINPKRFDRTICEQNIKTALARQLVYVGIYKDQIISKAQTNARGFGWDQLGGIFTRKKNRGIGAGHQTVAALCEHIIREQKGVCLFVKKNNQAAIQLYKNLGFRSNGPFNISYDSTKI